MREKENRGEESIDLRQHLMALELFLNTFGELLPGGVGIYEYANKRIRPLYLSSGVLQMGYGFDDEYYEKMARSIEHLVSERDYQFLLDNIEGAMQHDAMLDCTLRYRMTPTKNGWVWIRSRKLVRRGRKTIFIALILDVTKQKKLENELRVQNERYRILEETSGEILFELKLFEDVMTYSYKEIDGGLIRKRIPHYSQMLEEQPMVHPDYIEVFGWHLETARSRCAEGQFEYLSRISGRGYEWHRMIYSSIEDEEGNVDRIIGRIKNVHDEVLKRNQDKSSPTAKFKVSDGIQHKIRDDLDEAELEDSHALAIVGINDFRKIQEQNGMACGDAVMRMAMQVVRQVMGEDGLVGREHGGKVLLYFTNISEEELDRMVRDIIARIEDPENAVAGLTVTCSAGSVIMEGATDYPTICREAEEALHIARITKGEQYIRV